jgi:hypothetical protein
MANESFEREDEVRGWMQELATIPIDSGPLLDARDLWLKAQLLKQWDAQRQVIAPIERAEPVQISIGVAGALVLLAWLWRSVPASTNTLTFATILSLVLLAAAAILTVAGLIVEGAIAERSPVRPQEPHLNRP